MDKQKKHISILIAEDDPDDRLMIKEVFEDAGISNPVHFVKDGEELMDFLLYRGRYEGMSDLPHPGLILLDLNMPRKDGREVLKEIRSNAGLRKIPIVAFTTSNYKEDVNWAYELGVNSYISKPMTFEALRDVIETIVRYWFEIVQLPV